MVLILTNKYKTLSSFSSNSYNMINKQMRLLVYHAAIEAIPNCLMKSSGHCQKK